jgi:predicted porin
LRINWRGLALAITLADISATAAAQSSVTIYGQVDAGITYVNNTGGKSLIAFKDGQNGPNLWGFTGTEDLGGGLHAIFLLRDQFVLGTGTFLPGQDLWSKTAYVGLSDERRGTLTLGEQYDFMRDLVNDSPAEYSGHLYSYPGGPFTKLAIPGNSSGSFDWSRLTGTPISNSVKYVTPSIGGLRGGVLYGFGNVAGSIGAGNSSSYALLYARGTFGADIDYTTNKYVVTGGPQVTVRTSGAGARYEWGPWFVTALATAVRNVAVGAAAQSASTGARYRFTPSLAVGLSYMYLKGNTVLSNAHANEVAGIVDYAFSKSTSVYALSAYQRANQGSHALIDGLLGPTAPSTGQGQLLIRVGLRTRF